MQYAYVHTYVHTIYIHVHESNNMNNLHIYIHIHELYTLHTVYSIYAYMIVVNITDSIKCNGHSTIACANTKQLGGYKSEAVCL